jgi:hypothetical protein
LKRDAQLIDGVQGERLALELGGVAIESSVAAVRSRA